MNEEKRNKQQRGRGVWEKLAAVCAALSLAGPLATCVFRLDLLGGLALEN
ncbi:MAG TPA: hypothetical protein H9770_02455 [Candidatus Fournierella excrementigallinarum]|nr:hypothetical protein [Candidatus Fournierella excrementigallinarum]